MKFSYSTRANVKQNGLYSMCSLVELRDSIPLNKQVKLSWSARISFLRTSWPAGEVLARTTSPRLSNGSSRSSPWACLFKSASSGASAFSIASLSLRERLFKAGTFSRARANQPIRSSWASLYRRWSLYCASLSNKRVWKKAGVFK